MQGAGNAVHSFKLYECAHPSWGVTIERSVAADDNPFNAGIKVGIRGYNLFHRPLPLIKTVSQGRGK